MCELPAGGRVEWGVVPLRLGFCVPLFRMWPMPDGYSMDPGWQPTCRIPQRRFLWVKAGAQKPWLAACFCSPFSGNRPQTFSGWERGWNTFSQTKAVDRAYAHVYCVSLFVTETAVEGYTQTAGWPASAYPFTRIWVMGEGGPCQKRHSRAGRRACIDGEPTVGQPYVYVFSQDPSETLELGHTEARNDYRTFNGEPPCGAHFGKPNRDPGVEKWLP